MIETNTQNQRQDKVSLQPSPVKSGTSLETGLTVRCAICEAVYAPSPLQAPFLQSTREALEATFMSTCHFCFRCRRAACPQCWDGVHGVCGSCVLEARLPFRAEAAPLAGMMFPPALHQSLVSQQPQQSNSLLVLVQNGRFYVETQITPGHDRTGIDTNPAIQRVPAQPVAFDGTATDNRKSDVPVAIVIPARTPLPAVLNDDRKQAKKPVKAKAAKKASRLELVLTWIVLAIVLLLVVVIALAEYIPAVNALVARLTHIDIHAEIAYLVHVVRQVFKQ